MFRYRLFKNETDNKIYLKNKWCKRINGLARVPFFDEDDKLHGYVVYYSEVK